MRIASIELRNSAGARLKPNRSSPLYLRLHPQFWHIFAASCLNCIDVRRFAWSKYYGTCLGYCYVKPTGPQAIKTIARLGSIGNTVLNFEEMNAPHSAHSAAVLCHSTATLPLFGGAHGAKAVHGPSGGERAKTKR